MPLVPVLSRMERTGVLIDANVLAAQSVELTARLDELEKQAFAIAGKSSTSLHRSSCKPFCLKTESAGGEENSGRCTVNQ